LKSVPYCEEGGGLNDRLVSPNIISIPAKNLACMSIKLDIAGENEVKQTFKHQPHELMESIHNLNVSPS